MIYLTELAEKLGIDPVEAAKAKVEKNGKNTPPHWPGARHPNTRSTNDGEDLCIHCRKS